MYTYSVSTGMCVNCKTCILRYTQHIAVYYHSIPTNVIPELRAVGRLHGGDPVFDQGHVHVLVVLDKYIEVYRCV